MIPPPPMLRKVVRGMPHGCMLGNLFYTQDFPLSHSSYIWDTMRYFRHISLLPCFIFFITGSSRAQFKTVYLPDTTGLKVVTQFKAAHILQTNRPGAPLTITGLLVALDSTGQYPQPWYLMHTTETGLPQGFHWYVDGTAFLFGGAGGFASAWDGDSTFYVAGSSNNYQCLFSAAGNGDFNWCTAIHHHDFYDILYENDSSIIALGQDESFLGVHDFSLVRLDSSGDVSAGFMLGTEGFDLPEKVIATPAGYLVCGSSFISPDFQVFVAEVDTAFNLLWGYTYSSRPGNHFGKDVVRMPDGSGYMIGGYLGGAATDSLFLLKITNSGVPVFFKTFHGDSLSKWELNSLAMDAATGNLFLAGAMGVGTSDQPFVLKTDAAGNTLWCRNYGSGADVSSESFSDVIVLSDGANFAACGSYYDLAAASHYRIMMVTASLDSGTIPCDTTVNVTTGSLSVTRDSAILSQPFLIQYSLPFIHHTSTMGIADVCSLVVHSGQPVLPETIGLRVVNPVTDQLLRLAWTLPGGEDRAMLSLWSERGELLHRENLHGNNGATQIQLDGRSAGLILLRMDSPSGYSAYQKIVVLR